MARLPKTRLIGCCPNATYFKPRGIPLRELEEVVLSADEIEALRLADIDCLYHEIAGGCMRVSRQTFGNILRAAHRKVADALVNSKALKIEGGHVMLKNP